MKIITENLTKKKLKNSLNLRIFRVKIQAHNPNKRKENDEESEWRECYTCGDRENHRYLLCPGPRPPSLPAC